jgi:CRP/FNR family transcriptional regulator
MAGMQPRQPDEAAKAPLQWLDRRSEESRQMKQTNPILGVTPLFKGLDEQQLDEISAITIKRRYRRGEAIFMEGDVADGFYIVADGQVKIFKTSLEGKEQILHIYGPGNPFGEVPVFSGSRFPANAQALVMSQVLFLPRKAFVDLIAAHPSLSMNMLAELSMRLRQFTVQIENLSLKEVPSRLASYLTVLAEEQAQPDRVSLTISKGQLASLLGTIPETLSRIFAKMSAQNLIRVEGRDIYLLDSDGLEDLAAAGKLAE